MTISFFIECNDCEEKYRIRYGVGNNYPQLAAFECGECSNKIEVGFNERNGGMVLNGAQELIDKKLFDQDIKVQNLHPEIPTRKGKENDPFHFQTFDVFRNIQKNKLDYGEFRFEQYSWSNFNSQWKFLKKPLRVIANKNELKLKEICNMDIAEFSKHFNKWLAIFIRGEQITNFEKIKTEFNSVDKNQIKNYVKQENKFLRKINDFCITYMSHSQQFQSTIFHQKYGWEINDDMIANINWENINTVYGDLYELIGDFFVIPTMINNIRKGRNYNEFESENFDLKKYLKIDKANKSKNFETNDNLAWLANAYHPWLRNGTHHKNSFLDPKTNTIDLGTSKGGTVKKTMPIIEYIKNCNELFGVGLILSSLILNMKK